VYGELTGKENCWNDHYDFMPTSAATPAPSSSLDSAIARLPKLPSMSVKAATSPSLFGWPCAPKEMPVPLHRSRSPESTPETSTKVVAVELPELSRQDVKVIEDVKSTFDKGAMLAKIANLEDAVKMLEASADPERQSFKNELLREQLATAAEQNRELQCDVKALNTREAKLRVEISDSETKLNGLEKVNAALSKDLDQERKESRASRTKSEGHLQALQEITVISTKAIMVAPREGSEAGSLTVCRMENNLSLTSPPPISPASSPSTSTLQSADSACSKTSSSPIKPPPTPAFGSASRFGANSLVFDPKKPSFGFGNLALPTNKSGFKNGPEQPPCGLPPSKSAPSPIPTHQAQPELKRKIEEIEGREGDQNAEVTTGKNDGQSKRARTATDEEESDSDSD